VDVVFRVGFVAEGAMGLGEVDRQVDHAHICVGFEPEVVEGAGDAVRGEWGIPGTVYLTHRPGFRGQYT
jgi:hypothetical protein